MSFIETLSRMLVVLALLMALGMGGRALVAGVGAISEPSFLRDFLGVGVGGVVACVLATALGSLFDLIGRALARRRGQESR